jgi:putative ABC transport system substrate-binding protein
MSRPSVVGTLALVFLAVAVPHGAGAQPAGKVARVGVLWPGELSPAATQLFERFREALRGLGWVEGSNLVIDYRAAEGHSERLPELAAALIETRPDVILTTAPRALQRATTNIPIVFVAAAEPVRNGLVHSLSRPGGNLTGSADMALELNGKRLEVLKDAFPRVRRIAVVWNPTNVLVYDAAGELRAAGPALGVELVFIEIRRREEFPEAFRQIEQSGADALAFLGDTIVLAPNTGDTLALAAKTRLPAIFPYRRYVDAGGLLSYGSNIGDFFSRAATTVDRILRGAKPADLPVEQPTKFELVVNLKTAQAMGFDFPQAFLDRADEVIE